MAKFHINKEGIPTACKANVRNCPYGGTGHYDTFAEAASVADSIFLKKHGLFVDDYSETSADIRILDSRNFKQLTYEDSLSSNAQISEVNYLLNQMYDDKKLAKRAGLQYEVAASIAYADELELSNTLVVDNNGQHKYMYGEGVGEQNINNIGEKAYNKAYNLISQKIKDRGEEVPSQGLLNVVHFSDDGQTSVVQMGGPNVLDLAVIKNDNVEFIEFKRMSNGGSQVSSSTLLINSDGKPIGGYENLSQHTQDEIQRIGMKNTIGTNVPVNLTKREALEEVVNVYKEKGADKISYLNKKNEFVEVDLSGDTKSVVKALEDKNIQATLQLRSNLTTKNPTKDDKERWNKKRAKEYFVNEEFPKDEFTINDLKPKYRNIANQPPCNGKATIGELVLPFRKSEIPNITKDTKIKTDTLKVRVVELIGNLKEK